MNKADLVSAVAQRTGLKKKDAEQAVTAVVEAIGEALQKGERVAIVGFGTFEVRTRRARVGRNPQTGRTIQIPPSKVPAFKPGKTLRDAIK